MVLNPPFGLPLVRRTVGDDAKWRNDQPKPVAFVPLHSPHLATPYSWLKNARQPTPSMPSAVGVLAGDSCRLPSFLEQLPVGLEPTYRGTACLAGGFGNSCCCSGERNSHLVRPLPLVAVGACRAAVAADTVTSLQARFSVSAQRWHWARFRVRRPRIAAGSCGKARRIRRGENRCAGGGVSGVGGSFFSIVSAAIGDQPEVVCRQSPVPAL